MNVLITSGGRRAYLVKYFKEALREDGGRVHVCNSDDLSVAFACADKAVVSPLIHDPAYIPFLLDYCRTENIDILLSVFDMDLGVLAAHKSRFEAIGVTVLVADAAFVAVCNDKWKTFCWLKENGFNTPLTFLRPEDAAQAADAGRLSYPVMIKPRFGCGSIGVARADNEEELFFLAALVRRKIAESYLAFLPEEKDGSVVFQEYVKGTEYGVDIINDLSGNFQNAIIHKKLAMRSGETDICMIAAQTDIFHTARRLGMLSGHPADLDCDIILKEDRPYVIEMNARFGGVYPFSQMAGCNLPLAILKWVKQEKVDPQLLTARVGATGFKELVLTERKR